MRGELDKLEIVLEYDKENAEMAHRLGKLAITLGDWRKAIGVLSQYVDSEYLPVLRDLGVAICKLYGANPDSPGYRQGQKYLEAASTPPNRDADALASLAGTWKEIDEDKARELYRQAFEVDPSDPYPLGNYLEYEISYQRNTSLVSLMRPMIDTAIRRCRDCADVGMNMPWAFYDIGKFYLFLGKPYESFAAYAKAVQLSTAEFMIDTSLKSLDRLTIVKNELKGHEWVRRLLLVGRATKFPTDEATEEVKKLASLEHNLITSPVVIVAGGCDASVEQQMQSYCRLMVKAFQDFKGTIISGGTTAGISGLVGEVMENYPDAIQTIGYVPGQTPAEVSIDKRYSEIRYTEGEDFSPLEALQYWVDLIAGGVHPSQIKLLGINGCNIAAAEYRIALALGAYVAIIEESGREAAKLLSDNDWSTSERLMVLPNDGIIVRAFIGSESTELAPDTWENIAQREIVAQAIHDDYRHVRSSSLVSEDPSMAEWNRLRENLKESNRQQADYILEKLRQIGCRAHQVTGRDIELMTFTENEIEMMAEMEHASTRRQKFLTPFYALSGYPV